jgi:2-polyprenyl-3-methyl-5-hydroxy-6-metoxy-1,4-benzoquinol methylase
MGNIKNFITSLHKGTNRDYLARMVNDKVACMLKAKEYEFEYWDGDRKFGYGGYNFIEGRWKPVAEALITDYNLTNSSKILDVGCGKGFLL